MLGLIVVILGNRRDADDVLQEAFSSVWRSAGSYRRDLASVPTWLLLITRSRAIDHLRRRCRESGTTEALLDDVELDGSPGGRSESAEGGESTAAARQALGDLPAEQREAVQLAFYRGLTHTQIATHQGVPLGTVKTRIRLGLEKLRERMDVREVSHP